MRLSRRSCARQAFFPERRGGRDSTRAPRPWKGAESMPGATARGTGPNFARPTSHLFLQCKKTMNRLRQQVKTALDAAITAGSQPLAPRSGLGLVVKTPAGRFRTLVDKKGITAAGKYYYEKSGLPPPRSFDYQQDTTRKGRTQFIRLLDGSQKAVSRWDNVNREWKITKLGTQF